jgi:hypothetical protein
MKHTMPINLRRPEERFAALKMADSILRADRRKQRVAAMPKPDKKKEAPTMAGPQHLHLSDLKRAFAARERQQRTERRRHSAQPGQSPKEF